MQPANNKAYIIKEIRGAFKGYGKKIAWRIAVLICLSFMISTLFIYGARLIEEVFDHYSKADALKICESTYYRGEYLVLLERLHLYEGYDERFDLYWEVAEAYEQLSLFEMWNEAAALEPQNDYYKERTQYYKDQVIKAYERSVDIRNADMRSANMRTANEENKLILQGFVQQLDLCID